MAKRLFGIYALVELAVVIALVATIGFGWTVLLLLASFVVGLALAGSQLSRYVRRLRAGLDATTAMARSPTACWWRSARCWWWFPAWPVR